MVNPSKYSDLKPKYIELYSKSPPKIAPSILEESAIPTSFSVESCFEKARPEKKTGIVKIAGIKNFNNTEGMLVKSKYVT